MGFQNQSYAQAFRDVVREIADKQINRLRPGEALGTVASIDTAKRSCTVAFPGGGDAVPVRYYTVAPTAVGDVVRVEGTMRRYVTEVVSGAPRIAAGTLTLSALPTTSASANAVVDATTGAVSRSTSSRRYKRDIETAAVGDEAVAELRAVTYESISDSDNGRFLGLVAEEIDAIGDPALDLLIVRDADGNPEAVAYDRLAVALLPLVQRLMERVQALEAR